MGTLSWVSERKRYLMGSVGNIIFLVSFSLVVLAKTSELKWTTDNDPAIKTTDNDPAIKTTDNDPVIKTIENDPANAAAYFNLIAPCPTVWSSLCLGCKFRKFYTRCRRQCQNICNACNAKDMFQEKIHNLK